MSLQRLARGAFYILLAAAPLGTRYIIEMGRLGGVEIEAGTISIFATQLLALALIVLTFFIGQKSDGKLSTAERVVFGSALVILLVAVLSAWSSTDLRSSMSMAWLFIGVGLCATIYRLRPSPSHTLWAIVIGGTVQSLFAFWQFAVQQVSPNKWLGLAAHLPETPGTFVVETAAGRWLRAYGTLPHPNMLGTYLAFAVIAAVALTIMSRRRKSLLTAALIVINTVGLALTMSRGALLGLLVGLGALVTALFIFSRVETQRWRQTILAVGFVLVALLGSLVVLSEPASARFGAQGRLEKISVESRVSQLHDVRILLPGNWPLGVGPGLTPFALQKRDPGRSPWDYQFIHNVPLLLLVELGLLGLLAWLAIVGSLLAKAARQRKQNLSADKLALRAAFVALLIVSLFDHFLWSAWFGQLIFWCVVGLIMASAAPKSPQTPNRQL